MSFAAKVQARLVALETENAKLQKHVLQLLNEVIELRRRMDVLDAKRGPGRPPKPT